MKTPAASIKQNKPPTWKCSCGHVIPKRDAKLSGGPQYNQGYHVHCPNCGKTIAQFINPSEIQQTH